MSATCGKLMVQVLCLLLATDFALTENRTPAHLLAKQTGATQFEEHFEQPLPRDSNERRHRLRKRSSDEDLDYEVYQGVVGRPGIDFPIFPRIPQTTFSCRTYGNGYFADLETGCQVFHICEEGRKISFLCPNGTIFQQSELTCDWWFKVNCAGSPSYYVESSEILSKARRQRVKPTPIHKNYSASKKVNAIPTGKPYKGSDRRIDSNENPSVESLDFEDISDDRSSSRSYERPTSRTSSRNRPTQSPNIRSNDKLKLEKEKLLTQSPPSDNPNHLHNDQELQITAETGSFINDPRNSYNGAGKTLNKNGDSFSDKPQDKNKDVTFSNIPRGNEEDINERQKTKDATFSNIPRSNEKDINERQKTKDATSSYVPRGNEKDINERQNTKDATSSNIPRGNEKYINERQNTKDATSSNIPRGNEKDINERQNTKDATSSNIPRGNEKDINERQNTKDATSSNIPRGNEEDINERQKTKDATSSNIPRGNEKYINERQNTKDATSSNIPRGNEKDINERQNTKDATSSNIPRGNEEDINERQKTKDATFSNIPRGNEKDINEPQNTKDATSSNIPRGNEEDINERQKTKDATFSNIPRGNEKDIHVRQKANGATSSIIPRGNEKDINERQKTKDATSSYVPRGNENDINERQNTKDATSSNIPQGNEKDINERQKTGKKIDDSKPSGFYITSRPNIGIASTPGKISYQTTAQPEPYTNRNSLVDAGANDKQFVTPEAIDRNFKTASAKPDFFVNGPILKSSTASYPGTYSTARKLDTTRTTPFYTPTVPSVIKVRPTESKTFFINVAKSDESTTPRQSISTDSTPRPLVIGWRHDDSEIHRVPIFFNGELNVPAQSAEQPKAAEFAFTTSTSGPTYLPKSTGADSTIHITLPSSQPSISPNIEGIIQTVNVLQETMKKSQDGKNGSTRVGLEIPPSSGPGTLISLTNYFANDNDEELTPTVSADEPYTSTPSVDISVGLLSNKTSGKYFSLFGLAQNDTEDDTDSYHADQVPVATTVSPKVINTPTVVGDFTRTTIRDLVKNPETRKIAQVFSNAITKYIENPDTFRKDLLDARPTQPTVRFDVLTDEPSTTPSSTTDEKASTAPIDKSTASVYLPTTGTATTTATEKDDTTTSAPTESNDIAREINSQLDLSTPAYELALTESTEATTYRGSSYVTSKPDVSISSELLPPNQDEENEHESLDKDQSQSFVKSLNDLAKSSKSISFDKGPNNLSNSEKTTTTTTTTRTTSGSTVSPKFDVTTYKGLTTTQKSSEKPEGYLQSKPKGQVTVGSSTATATTTPKPTTSPWSYSTITISTVVHHVTDDKPTTPSNPWLQNKKIENKPTENPWTHITSSIHLDPLTINDGLMRESKTTTNAPFAFVTADRSRFEDTSDADESIEDILNSPELSSENLPKNTGIQRIANKIFGGLNETEAVHLKNVMKKAEHNQNVLKLLLLLIQTCDDQNGRALERSRKLLLNALISMDGKFKTRKTDQATLTTTNKIPVTTYRGNFGDNATVIKNPTTTTDPSSSSEETTKFEIRVPDPEDEEDNTISTTPAKSESSSDEKSNDNPNRTSDARALELLKSLYSLASKFSRR